MRISLVTIPAACIALFLVTLAALFCMGSHTAAITAAGMSAREWWALALLGATEALGITVILFAGFWLARTVSDPVSAMARDALAITESGKDGRISSDGRISELCDLSLAFNRLLDEQRRRQSEIRDLSGNLLHDIKTPLANIRNDAEAALRNESDKDVVLANICESCNLLLSAITTNAEIASISSGLCRANRELVNVADEIAQAAQLYRFITDAKHQTLETQLRADDLLVLAHRIHIQQLVSNLLDNAVKYTPEGGRIRIAAVRKVEAIELEVSDTGIGIPPDEQEKIFERYYRADPSRHEPGFGLGLALVKSIVDYQSGTIFCRSTPDTGTTFTINLPSPPTPDC
ncbi:MAG: sensor histidine kinase [Kiritimatiellia bacterium]